MTDQRIYSTKPACCKNYMHAMRMGDIHMLAQVVKRLRFLVIWAHHKKID